MYRDGSREPCFTSSPSPLTWKPVSWGIYGLRLSGLRDRWAITQVVVGKQVISRVVELGNDFGGGCRS